MVTGIKSLTSVIPKTKVSSSNHNDCYIYLLLTLDLFWLPLFLLRLCLENNLPDQVRTRSDQCHDLKQGCSGWLCSQKQNSKWSCSSLLHFESKVRKPFSDISQWSILPLQQGSGVNNQCVYNLHYYSSSVQTFRILKYNFMLKIFT